ncbi:hypothetical protein BLNAU_6100 [Blattamonas nauphoetae]|uniref:Uncharacterized protein n=1 Tax=Blattamonas nauphoetae TaxID=2049346 RepID=A0ABQ9Y533_9EUKA|nr:hypothetical protein BLNAU_6100 [Blattamonas nauphoetae]
MTMTIVKKDASPIDCSPFFNWNEQKLESVDEKTVIFLSLVATVKLQPVLYDSLENKAVKFLKFLGPRNDSTIFPLFRSLSSFSDDSVTEFAQCILVLTSSSNRIITKKALKIAETLIQYCEAQIRLGLVEADLIPQLIINLNLQSLSFAEAHAIHTSLLHILSHAVGFPPQPGLAYLQTEYPDKQAAHETILKQVIVPSEQYIRYICSNRYSIIDDEQSQNFMILLTLLLQKCPYHQPTMDFILNMPVTLAIPSCLTFFENDESTRSFTFILFAIQRQWNTKRGERRQMWMEVHRLIRTEGLELDKTQPLFSNCF